MDWTVGIGKTKKGDPSNGELPTKDHCTILGAMKKVKERRFHTRYPEKGVVTYHRFIPQKRLPLKEQSSQGELKNVSRGGLLIVTEERLAPKQFLTLTVPLRFPGSAIPTMAYVQWTRPVRGTGRYAAGLSFLI